MKDLDNLLYFLGIDRGPLCVQRLYEHTKHTKVDCHLIPDAYDDQIIPRTHINDQIIFRWQIFLPKQFRAHVINLSLAN
jgi:hypothetical protein